MKVIVAIGVALPAVATRDAVRDNECLREGHEKLEDIRFEFMREAAGLGPTNYDPTEPRSPDMAA